MYNIIRIHTPAVALPDNVVRVSTLTTIPKELREAIHVVNCNIQFDTNDGIKTAPGNSLIGYEKSVQTASGYHCWIAASPYTNLVKIDGTIYVKSPLVHAMLIPDKNESQPLWARSCNLTYNGDGTATLETDNGKVSGRIGIDFLLCYGMKKNGKPKASILATYDESYKDYIICDESGNDVGKLSEHYPA